MYDYPCLGEVQGGCRPEVLAANPDPLLTVALKAAAEAFDADVGRFEVPQPIDSANLRPREDASEISA